MKSIKNAICALEMLQADNSNLNTVEIMTPFFGDATAEVSMKAIAGYLNSEFEIVGSLVEEDFIDDTRVTQNVFHVILSRLCEVRYFRFTTYGYSNEAPMRARVRTCFLAYQNVNIEEEVEKMINNILLERALKEAKIEKRKSRDLSFKLMLSSVPDFNWTFFETERADEWRERGLDENGLAYDDYKPTTIENDISFGDTLDEMLSSIEI